MQWLAALRYPSSTVEAIATLPGSDSEEVSPVPVTSDTPHRTFALGPFSMDVATEAGPRILNLRRDGIDGMFARLPDLTLETPGGAPFRFLGGHRLWRAPEDPTTTYEPDEGIVRINATATELRAEGEADSDGIRKSLVANARGDHLVVDHLLENTSRDRVRVAPWGITQLELGGTAYLPLPRLPTEAAGVSANRNIVLWPYTRLDDPDITLTDEFVKVWGSQRSSPSKVGVSNQLGWIAYYRDPTLFVKWSPIHLGNAVYADLGASVQCYRNGRFLELETLGPLVELAKGQSVSHREVWMIEHASPSELDGLLSRLPRNPIAGDT